MGRFRKGKKAAKKIIAGRKVTGPEMTRSIRHTVWVIYTSLTESFLASGGTVYGKY